MKLYPRLSYDTLSPAQPSQGTHKHLADTEEPCVPEYLTEPMLSYKLPNQCHIYNLFHLRQSGGRAGGQGYALCVPPWQCRFEHRWSLEC